MSEKIHISVNFSRGHLQMAAIDYVSNVHVHAKSNCDENYFFQDAILFRINNSELISMK
jgi:hypothetical protein